MSIEDVSDRTVIALISELGPEGFKKSPTNKHFCSWLRLSPNNKISGGKKLSRRVGRGSNNVKTALRRAVNVLGSLKDSHLGQFFRKIAYRKVSIAAITDRNLLSSFGKWLLRMYLILLLILTCSEMPKDLNAQRNEKEYL